MLIKQIHVEADYWPPDSLQDTPLVKDEIANVQKFIEAVQAAGAKFLPSFGARLVIKEKRDHSPQR